MCLTLLSLWKVSFLLLVIVMLCGSTESSQLEIQAFQPAVVPIRAITTLTLQTSVELNVTSHTSLQCRFKDISVPAKMEDGFIFCDTPPMRNTDRVSVYLDVDGKLFKTKKPLYLHEPFKVSNITPSVVSPAQNVYLTVSGFSCQDWLQYFVRFQTASGTKKTQQGICRHSVVSCYVPEFPPSTRLRVGLTLSNRLVEWADRKILIQYPIDAIKSSVKDVNTDITKQGAFRFVVVLRDRFRNPIKVIKSDNKQQARISVQYSSQDKPQSMGFLACTTAVRNRGSNDEYVMSCTGAEKEHIFFYPSINNVPLGGQDKYAARTTLCPGKDSCEAQPKSFVLVIVLSCVGAVLVVSLVAVFMFVRYKVAKKQRVVPEMTTELEMEVQLPENVDPKTSDEEEVATGPTEDNVSDADTEFTADVRISQLHLGSAECEQGDQAEVQKMERDQNNEQSDEMKIQHFEHDSGLSAAEDSKETADPSVVADAEFLSGDETLTVTEGSDNVQDVGPSVITSGVNVSSCGEQFLAKAQTQTTQRRKSRLGNNRVLPTECDSITLGQTKYTERFKTADSYRQAWINSILGEDESHERESEA